MDLLIIIVLLIVIILLEILTSGVPRIALAIIHVLFPRKPDLSLVVRMALGLGLSIVVTALLGLVLNYTPWGLYFNPLLVSVTVFIVLMCVIAWFMRRRTPAFERFYFDLTPVRSFVTGLWSKSNWHDRVVTVLLVIAIIGVGMSAALLVAKSPEGEKFTEFYILGPRREAAAYPQELAQNEEARLIIGMVNQEYTTSEYSIGISSGNALVTELNHIMLQHGEQWEQEIGFTPSSTDSRQRIEFNLYKDNQPLPYRTLYLWINVQEIP